MDSSGNGSAAAAGSMSPLITGIVALSVAVAAVAVSYFSMKKDRRSSNEPKAEDAKSARQAAAEVARNAAEARALISQSQSHEFDTATTPQTPSEASSSSNEQVVEATSNKDLGDTDKAAVEANKDLTDLKTVVDGSKRSDGPGMPEIVEQPDAAAAAATGGAETAAGEAAAARATTAAQKATTEVGAVDAKPKAASVAKTETSAALHQETEFTLAPPSQTWDDEAKRIGKELSEVVFSLGQQSSALAASASASASVNRGMSEDGVVTEVRDAAHMSDIVTRAQSNSRLVLVDFFATWCGPCVRIAPFLAQLATQFRGRMLVIKCDVDRHKDIAQTFSVTAMPTFHFILNGQSVANVRGANDQALLQKATELAPPASATTASSSGGGHKLGSSLFEQGPQPGRECLPTGAVRFPKVLDARAASRLSTFNTAIKSVTDTNNHFQTLTAAELVSVRMAIENPQSRSIVDKARKAMVTVLESWPLECAFPVLDCLRSTLASPTSASVVTQDRRLVSALCMHTLCPLDVIPHSKRKAVTINSTLSQRALCNLVTSHADCGDVACTKLGKIVSDVVMFNVSKAAAAALCEDGEEAYSGTGSLEASAGLLTNCSLALLESNKRTGSNSSSIGQTLANIGHVASCALRWSTFGFVDASPFDLVPAHASFWAQLCQERRESATAMAVCLVKARETKQDVLMWVGVNKLLFANTAAMVSKVDTPFVFKERVRVVKQLLLAIGSCAAWDTDTTVHDSLLGGASVLSLCEQAGVAMLKSRVGEKESVGVDVLESIAADLGRLLRCPPKASDAAVRATSSMPNPWG